LYADSGECKPFEFIPWTTFALHEPEKMCDVYMRLQNMASAHRNDGEGGV
jgi:hypothetical protein